MEHTVANDKRGAVGGSDVSSNQDNNQSRKSRGSVEKPNFLNPHRPLKVSVVKQDSNFLLNGKMQWRFVAQQESERNEAAFQHVDGARSIICLDISESMAEAWTEAYAFLTDYLAGIEKMSKSRDLKSEHVALVTFGHETKIQMGYTTRYDEVRRSLDDITFGGPSQMYGGLLMALAAVPSRNEIEQLDNGAPIFLKVIMVTDGRPTELDLIAGPDLPDNSKLDETKAEILQLLEHFLRLRVDVFLVPVGSSDMDFVNTMVTCSGGMLLDHRHGKRLSKRQFLAARLLKPMEMKPLVLVKDSDLSNEDMEDLMNIKERLKLHLAEGPNRYGESKSKQLPLIGSRVRRGPDWHEGMEDSNGPGTVIGHCTCEKQVFVEWDADGCQSLYDYEPKGYEVLVVDEPRKLSPGEKLAVGCEVKPGKDWKGLDRTIKNGVVTKLNRRSKKATVRWDTGKRGDYSYGDDGLYEIETETGIRNSRGAVSKPGFLNPPPSQKVVKQDNKLTVNGEEHWKSVAQQEFDRNEAAFQNVDGVYSIICLDISESMAEAWTEAYTFLTDYLEGLEKMSKSKDLKPEHVALVTFGHETKIQMGYTTRYDEVRRRLDDIKLDGPTHMYGGILMAYAAVASNQKSIEKLANDAVFFKKVIVVTDGRPTELDLIAGPDIQDHSKLGETKRKILQLLERFGLSCIDVFLVPVGSFDMNFVNAMATSSVGMLLDYRHGKRLSRRQSLAGRLLNPWESKPRILVKKTDSDLSNEDKEDLLNIKERIQLLLVGKKINMYAESKSKLLPFIGSRVRRGPDWQREDIVDSNGPGTVIGHCTCENEVWVEWDADGSEDKCKYGPKAYEVLVVDEPRRLKPGENLAVGCVVKPGKDWVRLEGNMNSGVVTKLNRRSKKATVRWDTGKRGEYSYGDDGLQEIEIETGIRSRGASLPSKDSSFTSSHKWESQAAMTIEEFTAKKTKKRNKNILN